MNAHEILIKLKSVFSDTASAGFGKMMGGIQSATRGVTGVIRGLGAQLESIGGVCGKVAGGVVGVVGAFKEMGVVGGIVAGATMSIDWLVDKCMAAKKAAAEAALEFANFVKASGDASRMKAQREQIDRLNNALAQATTVADAAAKRFDALANAYLKVAAAAKSADAATSKDTLSQLNFDKRMAMMNAGSNGGAAMAGADFDIRIANQKLADAVNAHAAAVEIAAKQAKDDADRLAAAQARETAAADAVAQAEKELALAKELAEHDEKQWGAQAVAVQNRLNAARQALENATTARINAETAATVSASAAAQAETERQTAIRDAKLEVAIAEHAKAELEAAEAAAKQAEAGKEQAAKLLQERTQTQKELAATETEFRDAQQELQKAVQERAAAEAALAAAEAAYYKNFDSNIIASAIFGHHDEKGSLNTNWGQFLTAIGGDLNKQAVANAIRQGLADGQIKTVAEMNKFAGNYAREFAKNNQQQAQRMAQEQQRYEELLKKNPRALSPQDKKFMEDYEKIIEAQLKAEKEMMDARMRADAARINEQLARDAAAQQARDVADIKRKLDQLGLK